MIKRIHSFKLTKKNRLILICAVIILTTSWFWGTSDLYFNRGKENAYAVSIIAAGKHDLDVSGIKFGLNQVNTVYNPDSFDAFNSYSIYYSPDVFGGEFAEYDSQIGLHGWLFYYIGKYIPQPFHAIALGLCLALSIVLVLISLELNKKYGFLFAIIFFLVSVSSSWVIGYAKNMHKVEFTLFLPMLLGLVCLNNLNRRLWLYPLFFLAVLIKCLFVYEFLPTVMLSSVIFLGAEFFVSIGKDRKRTFLLLRTILTIGIISLLAFTAALLFHSYLRGDGDIRLGLENIYQNDVMRRTFGESAEFSDPIIAKSLNASVFVVLAKYFTFDPAGIYILCLCIAMVFIVRNRHVKGGEPLNSDFWLFIISFTAAVSWFILAKSSSYIHTHLYFIVWYIGFAQIGTYVAVKAAIKYILSDKILLKKLSGFCGELQAKLHAEIE